MVRLQVEVCRMQKSSDVHEVHKTGCVAAKDGSPEFNSSLRVAIDKAKL